MLLKLSGKVILRKFLLSWKFCGFSVTPALKVPFPGVLDIGQFHSPQMKPCESPGIHQGQISFHVVVDKRQGESNIFQISTWKAFLLLN